MSEETQLAPEQQPDQDTTAPAAEPNNTDTPAVTPEQHMIPISRFNEVNNELKALREQQAKATKAAEEAQRKQLEEQNKFKELYEAEQKKAAEALQTAERIQRERLQLEVATAAGYPGLWNRIQGGDEDELKADLKALIDALPEQQKPTAPNLNGGAGPGGRKPGKPAPTEAEIREQAARLGVNPQYMAEQYGVQLTTK